MRTGPAVVALGLAVLAAAGCARPGQLGMAAPPPVAVAAPAVPSPAPTPAPPTGPVLIGTGRLDERLTVRTSGPAVLSVRTEVLPPGGTTGWHRHPGTEMSIVRTGRVTVQREDSCTPERYVAGEAVSVPDGQLHAARNDGPEPAELVVTHLLEPGEPERTAGAPAC